jgi:hypothetical protein
MVHDRNMRFVHSGDWQIGMAAAQVGAVGDRVRAVRLDTCSRVVKDIRAGLLAMILGVIIVAAILLAVLLRSQRELAVGPVYLLVPIVSLTSGYYWSLRRSARPKAPPKPSSNITIILKSTAVGIAAMVLSVIAYVVWMRIPRHTHTLVAIDVHVLLYWPVLLIGFLAGFFLEFRWTSRRRSMLTGGMAQ